MKRAAVTVGDSAGPSIDSEQDTEAQSVCFRIASELMRSLVSLVWKKREQKAPFGHAVLWCNKDIAQYAAHYYTGLTHSVIGLLHTAIVVCHRAAAHCCSSLS